MEIKPLQRHNQTDQDDGSVMFAEVSWVSVLLKGSHSAASSGLTNQFMLIVLNCFCFCCDNAALRLSAWGKLESPGPQLPPPDPHLSKVITEGGQRKGGADRI